MDAAEKIAAEYADVVYLGVGLHGGYGSAQRMYVKRGYIPDGTGVWYGEKVCPQYAECCNDDDLVLYFSKKSVSTGLEMFELRNFADDFVIQSKNILGDNLTGIYLHGSAAMGCFNARKSDIDLLVVVKDAVSDEIKRRYMDMVVAMNQRAPEKGIELSIVKESVCNPFVYPTPFELHFSIAHLNWYILNPEDYVNRMKGTDKDLAAHCTIIYHRGKTLYGRDIKSVFSEVSSEDYMDSIWSDIENAKDEIVENAMYIILNLCRVLAYKKERLILSKQEGGEWAINEIAATEYKKLISEALNEYQTGDPMALNHSAATEFAEYMLKQIKS